MTFSTLSYIFLFFPIVLILYFIIPLKLKNSFLVMVSLVYLFLINPISTPIIVVLVAINYSISFLIKKYKNPFLLTLILIFNIIFVLFIREKFIDNMIISMIICLITLQIISYLIDIYNSKINVEKNIISLLTYLTMFPKILYGPVLRYGDIYNDIYHKTTSISKVGMGAGMFVRGLSKKVLLANTIGLVWDQIKIMDYTTISTLTAWLGTISFAFQFYFTLSGYSDMACGISKMLGFNLPINFDYPYMSTGFKNFWSRWNITVFNFAKLYIYNPINKSKNNIARFLISGILSFFVIGFFQTPYNNFFWFSLYWILLLGIEFLLKKLIKFKIHKSIKWFVTIFFINIGFMLIANGNLTKSFLYIKSMFGLNSNKTIDNYSIYILTTYFLTLVICSICCIKYTSKLVYKIKLKNPTIIEYLSPIYESVLLILCIIFLVSQTYNPYFF